MDTSPAAVRHAHNPDRTAENGWAYWQCTGCGQLCHYASKTFTPAGITFCPCCTASGALPCLACGDPCLPADCAEHIRTKHPVCTCGLIKGAALFECSCPGEDPTEAEFDAMLAKGTPVQLADTPET